MVGAAGFLRLPKINIGKVLGKAGLDGLKQTLKRAIGEFFKSGFEAAKKSFLYDISRQRTLPSPSQAGVGSPGASVTAAGAGASSQAPGSVSSTTAATPAQAAPANSPNIRALIADNLGPEMLQEFDKLTPAQQRDMAFQVVQQKTQRMNQLLTNMLQTLHEMSKAIIQNTRG